MNQIQIKRLTTADYDAYFTLRLASLRECPHMYATNAEEWENAPRETVEKHLKLSETEQAPILGAWAGDELVGLILVLPDYRPTVQHKATLGGFYVAPAHRNQGIGTKLLAETVNVAEAKPELKQLRAVVNATGLEAVNLFKKAGFRPFGTEIRAKFIDGAYHDQIYYWYDLDERN